MSIASLTTFGFGSFSTVNLAVAFGYGAGTTTTIDTHDGAIRVPTKEYLAELKRKQKKLEKKRQQKRLEAEQLRYEIDKASGLYPDEIVEEIIDKLQEALSEPIKPVDLKTLKAQLYSLDEEISKINAIRLNALREYRRARDERDMSIILQLLNIVH